MAVRAGTQDQLVMVLVVSNSPYPMRMIVPNCKGSLEVPYVPKTKCGVIARAHNIILFVGIKINATNHLISRTFKRPGLLHGIDIPATNVIFIYCGKLLTILMGIPCTISELIEALALKFSLSDWILTPLYVMQLKTILC